MKSVLLILGLCALGVTAIASVAPRPRPRFAPVTVMAVQPDALAGMRAKAARDAELERMGAAIERYQAAHRH